MDKRKLLKLEQILNVKSKKDYLIVITTLGDNDKLTLKSIFECSSKQSINIIKNEEFNNIDEIYKEYNINPERDKIFLMSVSKFIWGND
jgi:hypothetical protein